MPGPVGRAGLIVWACGTGRIARARGLLLALGAQGYLCSEGVFGVQKINAETGKSWRTVSAQAASRKREGPDIRSCYWTSKDLRGTGQNSGQRVQASVMSQVVLSEPPGGKWKQGWML